MSQKGFTLIELLIVIAIIALLVGAIIIAINPGRQFQQGRDTQRLTGVNAILNAVHQNMADNDGVWTCDADGDTVLEPTGDDALPSAAATMADSVTDPTGYDICACITTTVSYLAEMPYDPVDGSFTDCTTYDADYTIMQDAATERVTVAAPGAEQSTISVTR